MLTILNDPRIKAMMAKYLYLAGLIFGFEDKKNQHSIHIILGKRDIPKIKSGTLNAAKTGKSVDEKTLLGSTLKELQNYSWKSFLHLLQKKKAKTQPTF